MLKKLTSGILGRSVSHVQEYVPGTSLPRALLEAFLIILLFLLIPLVVEIPALERLQNSFSQPHKFLVFPLSCY